MLTNAKYRRIADDYVAAIRRGDLKPGDELPSVRQLSAEHGSTTAVAAMRWLRDNGWTVPTPGAGTRVADPLPDAGPTLEERVAELERWRTEHERGHPTS